MTQVTKNGKPAPAGFFMRMHIQSKFSYICDAERNIFNMIQKSYYLTIFPRQGRGRTPLLMKIFCSASLASGFNSHQLCRTKVKSELLPDRA